MLYPISFLTTKVIGLNNSPDVEPNQVVQQGRSFVTAPEKKDNDNNINCISKSSSLQYYYAGRTFFYLVKKDLKN